jgi:hypothetical protein
MAGQRVEHGRDEDFGRPPFCGASTHLRSPCSTAAARAAPRATRRPGSRRTPARQSGRSRRVVSSASSPAQNQRRSPAKGSQAGAPGCTRRGTPPDPAGQRSAITASKASSVGKLRRAAGQVADQQHPYDHDGVRGGKRCRARARNDPGATRFAQPAPRPTVRREESRRSTTRRWPAPAAAAASGAAHSPARRSASHQEANGLSWRNSVSQAGGERQYWRAAGLQINPTRAKNFLNRLWRLGAAETRISRQSRRTAHR